MTRIFLIFAIMMVGLIWYAPQADAQVRASCAQVRCASGSCIDTPEGAVCGAQFGCASTLCVEGTHCVETTNGPQCVKPDNAPWTPWPSEPQACPANYDPVCAQKQVQCVRAPCPPVTRTFSNSCEASRKGFYILAHGKCWTQPQPDAWSEPQPQYCPANYDPVCGRKGRELRTKSNRCVAIRDNFEILHSGECR